MRIVLFVLLSACTASGESDRDGAIACGDALTCADPDVCLRESFPADCTADPDTDGECPEGTTSQQCGGAGSPCCCGPTPEPAWSCYTPSDCGGEPTCDCVEGGCGSGKECTSVGSETSGVFSCDEPPKP